MHPRHHTQPCQSRVRGDKGHLLHEPVGDALHDD